MRATLLLALLATVAFADTTEPDGVVVPRDSMNGETQLFTLFTSLNDPLNWLTDAHITPNAFSPLCGFTATFAMKQSGATAGLAWFNDTGVIPAPADLHLLVPAGSPVGTVFTGSDIKSDPAYAGGLIGFALLVSGGETHFSKPAYNTVCSNCSMPGPWITAVIYASKATSNAYYMCFEDGPTNASTWSNDGDFNDFVFFLTGLTCEGGGQPCDTGQPGICGNGVSQCATSGVTCQTVTTARAESCNGLDDDCDGTIDEDTSCGSGQICSRGHCVEACGGEFLCAGGSVCLNEAASKKPAPVTCAAGQVCAGGNCVGPCDGVVCPGTEICRVGRCVDACAGVTCESGKVCTSGVCVTSCTCQPCGAGTTCNATSGQCVDPSCANVTCDAGSVCSAGTCVDACANAVCPRGQFCRDGDCLDQPDAGMPDAGTMISDAGESSDAGGGTIDAGTTGSIGAVSACGCQSGPQALFIAGLFVLLRRRSRLQ